MTKAAFPSRSGSSRLLGCAASAVPARSSPAGEAPPAEDGIESRPGYNPVARRRLGPAPGQVACFPPPLGPWNPYLALLYRHLAVYGLEPAENARFTLRWLWAARSRARFVHFNWPEGHYRFERGPMRVRPLLSWTKLILFGARLVTARALGYHIVWTIHQVYPHETTSRRLDRLAALLLSRVSNTLIAHDRATAQRTCAELRTTADIKVVPHGSYIGVYPPGRPRSAVRAELGISADAFAFLSFGMVRAYKDLMLLLQAFASVPLANAALVVAGFPRDRQAADAIQAAAAADPRVKAVTRYIPDERVAELFDACDAAVIARGDGGTSGSLVLALSMGMPVVAADAPVYRELVNEGRAGWLFRPGDSDSLGAALEEAASDPATAHARGRAAHESAARFSWPEIAERTARLFLGTGA